MKKKLITIVLTLIMAFSVIPATTLQTSAVTSAKINSSSYCTVKINQSLINKKGKQYAKVKLKTYDMLGWFNSGAKVKITLKDGNGKFICSWVGKGGDTLKLGDDHSVYRIYVDYYNNPGNNFISQANNFSNLGSSYKWQISNAKDCKIS
ncbi:MAG: hypothetical protein J6B12_05935 [Clostridia bacterium]|nr:hypothetical protein [Clostridia bacterium]